MGLKGPILVSKFGGEALEGTLRRGGEVVCSETGSLSKE